MSTVKGSLTGLTVMVAHTRLVLPVVVKNGPLGIPFLGLETTAK